MAVAEGAITQDSDLADIMSPHDLGRLLPPGWANMDKWHIKAWTEILAFYAAEPDPITEDMMSTPAQLIPAAVHNVAMQAYRFGRDRDMAKDHREEYLRQLNQIKLSVSDVDGEVTTQGWGGGIEMGRG